MTIAHPVSSEPLTLVAPLAEDFAAVLEKLGWKSAVHEVFSTARLEAAPNGDLQGI